MRWRILVLLLPLFWWASALAQAKAGSAQRVPESCPVTRQSLTSLFIPPTPYPAADPSPNRFWFGRDRLWTSLPMDGVWGGVPVVSGRSRAYREKLFYWRAGHDARRERPTLIVKGTRLDAPAPPLATDEHPNSGWNQPDKPFMVIGVIFPTAGCWKVTGTYSGDELTFVAWVD